MDDLFDVPRFAQFTVLFFELYAKLLTIQDVDKPIGDIWSPGEVEFGVLPFV
jgi:hypothetical protein